MYGDGECEVMLGKALGARRQDVIVASKFGWALGEGTYNSGGSRHYIFKAVEASLKRLGTDYIDLYQFHLPDPKTPIDETLEALSDLVRQGKVRYIGSSNFSGWQIADAEWTSRGHNISHFICAQNEWSLLKRDIESDVIPACQHFDIGMLPFFPLASGFLTGKYVRGQDPEADTRLAKWGADYASKITSESNWDRLEALTQFAERRGHTMLELALSWLASSACVSSVIAGATSAEQVRSNVAATTAWQLSTDEMSEVDALLAGAVAAGAG